MFPFNEYKVIDVPVTNSESGTVIYTTTATCLLYFMPKGNRMEDDTPVEVFVNSYFTDTDGGVARLYMYRSQASTNNNLFLNYTSAGNVNVPVIAPAGKQVYARVGDNSDRIGGTLFVMELPNETT